MNIKRAYDPHRDLLELHGLERPACSNTLVPRGSHHISSLWSPVVATGGNRSQIAHPRKRWKQAKTVAVGCDQLPREVHGKEGVDGSSPSEGFYEVPANRHFVVVCSSNTRTRNGHIYGTGDAQRRC